MSYAEDYIEPFALDCEHGLLHGINCEECADEALEDDNEEWECAYPGKCLMHDPLHHQSECFTLEDAEAFDAAARLYGD